MTSTNDPDLQEDFIRFNFSDEDDDDEEPPTKTHPPPSITKNVNNNGKSKKRKRASSSDSDSDDSSTDSTDSTDSTAPWFTGKDYPLAPHLALNREVLDFLNYIEPTRVEHQMRSYVIARVSRVVRKLFPGSMVTCFGSYDTKLYLPTSDLDLVIMTSQRVPTLNALYTLSRELTKANVATSMNVVAKARVPIIKFLEVHTRYPVDISINLDSGIKGAAIVKSFLKELPAVRPLVLLVKHYLAQKSMNEVYTGGLGSYALMAMVVSFLQMHPMIQTRKIDPERNLGVLLLEFFELYGANFNYERVGINITYGGSYFDKVREPITPNNRFHSQQTPFLVSIRDPQDYSNDISRGSHGFRRIMLTFRQAFATLTQEIYKRAQSIDQTPAAYLNSIIQISPEMIRHRQQVQACYEKGELQSILRLGPDGELPPEDQVSAYVGNATDDGAGVALPTVHSGLPGAEARMRPGRTENHTIFISDTSSSDDDGGLLAAAALRKRQMEAQPRGAARKKQQRQGVTSAVRMEFWRAKAGAQNHQQRD